MEGVKAPRHLFGFLAESVRLVLLYFWLQHFNLPWNAGTEFNLFFLYLIFPQVLLPLAWLAGAKESLPGALQSLAASVRWSVLGVDALACLWLFFHLGIDPGTSLTRPEFCCLY